MAAPEIRTIWEVPLDVLFPMVLEFYRKGVEGFAVSGPKYERFD